MKTVRNQMLAKLHILLQRQGGLDHKMALYSGYGVTSARDMSDLQLSDAIARLEGRPYHIAAAPVVVDPLKALRSDALCIMTRPPSARSASKRGLGVPNDWAILNPFIEYHGGKLLYQMGEVELHAFIKKLYAIRESGWFYRQKQQVTAPTPSDEPVAANQRPAVNIAIQMGRPSALLS